MPILPVVPSNYMWTILLRGIRDWKLLATRQKGSLIYVSIYKSYS
jgi:hypothetical protein